MIKNCYLKILPILIMQKSIVSYNSTLNIEDKFLKKNLPILKIGDKIKVGLKIIEGNKERVQSYIGIIIAKKNSSINSTITVRKSLQETGIERVFLIHSPKIDSITVLQSSKVRRSKLYFLRNLKGKASRLRQIF